MTRRHSQREEREKESRIEKIQYPRQTLLGKKNTKK
jgi:hypothetical protein